MKTENLIKRKKLSFLKLSYLYIVKNILNKRIKKTIENKHSFRKWWVKPHLRNGERKRHSAYFTLLEMFEQEDHTSFKNYLRMTPETFNYILIKVAPNLEKLYIHCIS